MRFKNQKNQPLLAKVSWRPTKKESRALNDHECIRGIQRVDQIWPFLKKPSLSLIFVILSNINIGGKGNLAFPGPKRPPFAQSISSL